MKPFTWYRWIGQQDTEEILTYITNSDSRGRFGSGFRFIKQNGEWKFEYSKNRNYVMNDEFNKETLMSRYDYPREFFIQAFNVIFTSTNLDRLF